jgi:hypothetical protein
MMAPEIVENNAYSMTVSIQKALEQVNPANEKHFKRGELHLLQVFLVCWILGILSDGTSISQNGDQILKTHEFNKSSTHLVNFTDLSSDTSYTLRLVFYEENDLHDLSRSLKFDFKTKKCSPLLSILIIIIIMIIQI